MPCESDFCFLPGFSELLFLFHKMSGTHYSWLIATMMGKVENEEEYEHRILDLYKQICQSGMDAGVKASAILPSHVHLHRKPITKFEFLVTDSQGKEMVCSVDSAEVVPPLLPILVVAYMPTVLFYPYYHVHATMPYYPYEIGKIIPIIGLSVPRFACARACVLFVCVRTCEPMCVCLFVQ